MGIIVEQVGPEVSCLASRILLSAWFAGVWCCFRGGTLAYWVTHSVGVSLMTLGFAPQSLVLSTQVCKYPNSTISKVLTVLKWQMIKTLNRKLLEKQGVQNHFASYSRYT